LPRDDSALLLSNTGLTEIEQFDPLSKNNPMQESWHLALTHSKNTGKNLTTFLGLVFW
jgi:hypothetical protein